MSSDGYRPAPLGEDGPNEFINVAVGLILTLITCGLYNLYWNYVQMQICNRFLEREEFSWLLWFILILVTCGLYHLYYQYKMGAAINEIQHRYGLPISEGLPIISVGTAIIGFGVVADCIHQYELNRIHAMTEPA